MYRHGFGDCFLLRFFNGEARCFSMVIDCGLKLNDKVEGVSIRNVVDDIAALITPAGDDQHPVLDILAITHEHWDHVSGFHPDQKLFDHFKISKIWMAWTENPADEEAAIIRKHIDKGVKALAIASERIQEKSKATPDAYKETTNEESRLAARNEFNKTVQEITSFFGPIGVTKTPGGITLKDKYAISVNSRKAMDHIKGFSGEFSALKYLYPGDLLKEEKLPGVRIYVLGPPKSAMLNKSNPSKGPDKEVYLGMRDHTLVSFIDHLMGFADDTSNIEHGPFLTSKVITKADAKTHSFYREYFETSQQYRTIDDDFMNLTGALAMQLDGVPTTPVWPSQ